MTTLKANRIALIRFIWVMMIVLVQSVSLAQTSSAPDSITSLDWSSTGDQAVGHSLGTIQIISSGGQVVKTLSANSTAISVAWNPSGTKLAYANQLGNAWVWDSTIDQVTTIPSTDEYIGGVTWSPDGNQLGIGSYNGTGLGTSSRIQIWNMVTLQLQGSIETNLDSFDINAITWNPADSSQIATGSASGGVAVWDVPTASLIQFLSFSEDTSVTSISWSKDGSQIAIGSSDGTLWIWNTSNWQSLTIALGGTINDVTWSIDKRVAVANYQSVQIVSPDTQQIQQTYPYASIINRVVWSPDGTKVLDGSVSGSTQVINVPSDRTKIAFLFQGASRIAPTRMGLLNRVFLR